MKNNKISFWNLLWWGTGIFFALVWLFPIVWMCIAPFKPYGHSIAVVDRLFSGGWTFENFTKLWVHPHYKMWMLNSLLIASFHTVLSTLICALAAYVFSQIVFHGKQFLFFLVFISFLIPTEAVIIPLFMQVVVNLKLGNNYLGILLPGLVNVFTILVMKNYFDQIPPSFSEAAKIDGASHFKIFTKIYLPMSSGLISTMAILAFISSWNSFMWPLLVMNSSKMYTLPVGLTQFLDSYVALDLTLPMAANLVAGLPTIICFLIFQKQITENTMMGGIKQ
ncbi:MAG: carbohydrate ABC transporter permease [Brevinema sp.]